MICPRCASEHTRVVKTMKSLKNLRWRKCESCTYSWMTEERPVKDESLLKYTKYLEKLDEDEGEK